jgi:anti-sigma factor RsiW
VKPPAKCLRLFARLSEYLDGELSARDCKAIRKHMEGCANCQGFLKTLEKTVDLCRRYPAQDVPKPIKAQARAELLAAYRAGMKKRNRR